MPDYPRTVTVVEVGPRDGLQNEAVHLSTAEKIAFVDRLTGAGLPVIEVGAFVSPSRIPQMAETAGVFTGISRRPGTRYTALVPNVTGLNRAREAGVTEIAIFAAASDTFSRRNINQSIDESFVTYKAVCDEALAARMRIRAYLSTCFGCPYEGDVPPLRVTDLTRRLLDLGVFEVSVSDTIGVAHPGQVTKVLEILLARVDRARLALHFHDTRGTALANVLTALGIGVSTFDASAGGLGGCPYAPGATGNLATEDLIYMLDGLGIETGVSLERLLDASGYVADRTGRALPSRVAQATRATRKPGVGL
ncbi:MAG: hydroxymethylglutaryl-CoA lyase [Acidobacteria bacterium]|nr:hydroxymethylglutaryl-CoA lyase [Acidobacteriota bacterium]